MTFNNGDRVQIKGTEFKGTVVLANLGGSVDLFLRYDEERNQFIEKRPVLKRRK